MNRPLLTLAICLLAAGCGTAPATPPLELDPPVAPVVVDPQFEINGDVPGVTTLSQFRVKHRVPEAGSDIGVSVVHLGADYIVAGERPIQAEFSFLDGVLFRIECHLKRSKKDVVLNHLVSKYGSPSPRGRFGRVKWDNHSSSELYFDDEDSTYGTSKLDDNCPSCSFVAEDETLSSSARARRESDRIEKKQAAGAGAATDPQAPSRSHAASPDR